MAGSRVVHVAQLQRLAGRLAFVSLVVPQVGFLRRGIDAAISDGLRSLHGCIPVVDIVKEELLAIAAAARDFPSFVLARDSGVHRRQLGTVYSDASATGWGVLHVHPDAPVVRLPDPLQFGDGSQGPRGWTVGRVFSPQERALPSAAREILAVIGGVTALDFRGGDIAWHSDATAAVSAISRWRTKSTAVATCLGDLWRSLHRRDLRLHLSHVYRDAELMPVADYLSRRAWRERQAEWQFPPDSVPEVLQALRIPHQRHLFADMFASRRNALFPRYCSRWAEPGSMGDAFHVEWRRPGWWWAFPPASQVERLVLRLEHLSLASDEAATSSGVSRRHRPSINVVLVFPEIPALDRVRPIVAQLARRSVLLSSASSSTATSRPLLPGLRLLGGDGRPAPAPPPWSLRAAWIHVA